MIENHTELLQELLKRPEGNLLEFKKDNADPERVGKYISALANMAALADAPYGYLVYGVDDHTHEVVGTAFSLDNQKSSGISYRMWLNSILSPKGLFDSDTFEWTNGKKVTIIRVNKTDRVTATFQGDEYGRVGDSLVSLSNDPALRRRIWQKILNNVGEDDAALCSIKENDLEQFLNVASFYRLLHQDFPSPPERVSRLINEGFILRRDDGLYDITYLGALCIGASFSLFPPLYGKGVEVVTYSGTSRVSETSIPTFFESGFLLNFDSIVEYILNAMGSKEIVTTGLRNSVNPIPPIIVREMLSNAIVHQDFSKNGGKILVECFPDRLEMYNDGNLAIDVDRIVDYAPRPQNRHFVELLSRFRICEGHGTSFDKIVAATDEYVLPPVQVKKEEYGVRVTVFKKKPWQEYTEEEKVLAVYLHCCLAYVDKKKATNETIRKRFGLGEQSKSQISRLLALCLKQGRIRKNLNNAGVRNLYYLPYWA